MKHTLFPVIQHIREFRPLVHNITNYVVMNTTANALLAIGASPVMAHAVEEIEEMVSLANALVVNIGTLSEHWVTAMHKACKRANELNIPIVLDPVGAGATSYRTQTAKDLLRKYHIHVIRGNASEVLSLVDDNVKTRGVDSSMNMSDQVLDVGKMLAHQYQSVICVSGADDLIVDKHRYGIVSNGHWMMTRITGMGCVATAVIGACVGVESDCFQATLAGMTLMGVCAELAAQQADGPASMQIAFIDTLHNIQEETFINRAKYIIHEY